MSQRNTSKGQLKWWGRSYSVRVRFADGSRRWVPLPEGLSHADAVARAELVAAEARRRASPADLTTLAQPGETLAEWSERWLTSRVQAGYRSTKDDRSRLKVHILPLLGGVKIATLSTDDVERVRDRLDACVRAGEIAWGTAQLTWALLKSMCNAARLSKDRDLRVRRDDPTRDVAPPDRGIVKAKQFLYPSEFLQLVSCEEVPLPWRRAVVLSVYLLLRQSELQALAWDDLDLEHGVAHVHRSVDRADRTADKTTKTETARRLAIEPTLMPLLRTMHERAGRPKSGRVLADLPPWYDLAKGLRAYLALAGVSRPELLARGPTRRWITFHDLRATGITWMAVRGDDPLKIRQRAGHQHVATTEKYIRLAEDVRVGFGQPFPEVPGCDHAP